MESEPSATPPAQHERLDKPADEQGLEPEHDPQYDDGGDGMGHPQSVAGEQVERKSGLKLFLEMRTRAEKAEAERDHCRSAYEEATERIEELERRFMFHNMKQGDTKENRG